MMERKITNLYTFILHAIAGYLNALTIMAYGRMTGVHTGNISNVFIKYFEGAPEEVISLLMGLGCFFLGNILIGILSEFEVTYRVRFWQLTIFHLASAVFLILVIRSQVSIQTTINVISFRLGIQNGLPVPDTNHRKTTTSLTGLMTTVGVGIGRTMRSRSFYKLKKLKKETLYLLTFIGGTTIAALTYYDSNFDASILFVVLEMMVAVFCFVNSFSENSNKIRM